VAVVLIAAAAALVMIDPSALLLQPALALAVLLAARRYPGERTLVALSASRGRPRVQAPSSIELPCSAEIALPRGGLLLGRSLAVRPPPTAAPAAA
jgi:hypothetical protein